MPVGLNFGGKFLEGMKVFGTCSNYLQFGEVFVKDRMDYVGFEITKHSVKPSSSMLRSNPPP